MSATTTAALAARARLTARLAMAWAQRLGRRFDDAQVQTNAGVTYATLRSAAFAIVPGRQKAGHLEAALTKMVGAACRTIRRTAA